MQPDFRWGISYGYKKIRKQSGRVGAVWGATSVQRDVLEAQSAFHNLNHLI